MNLRAGLACLAALVCAPTSWAQIKAGGEFQVNTYTTGDQYHQAIAMDASGDFVIAWTSDGQDGSDHGVRWRKFKSGGASQAAGPANVYTTSAQDVPSVAMDRNGNFVLTWASFGQDGDSRGIYARRFARSGAPLGGEFPVNSYTTSQQFVPSAVVADNGNFVISWESLNQDGDQYGIFGRLYDSAGNSLSEFAINTYTTGVQADPRLAMDAAGNFVVVWGGPGAGDDIGVFAQRFDASGNPQGGEFAINSYTTGAQRVGSVAMDASGKFVVVWQSTQEGSGFGIFGRRFAADGSPLGSEFPVNTFSSDNQSTPSVAMDEKGNFVVAWDSWLQDGDNRAVVLRQFDSTGVPQGTEIVVNTYTTMMQGLPRVASSPDGDFVVVWESGGPQDGDGYGIFAQRFGDLIFEDNFEGGGVGRWDTVQNDAGDLTVAPAGALAGTGRGLQAVVNDTNSIYVQDDSPDAENRYRARFYVDPSGIDPGEAQGHQRIRIFLAHDALSQRVVTIVLKRLSGQYSVEAKARQNDGSRVETGFFDITDAPHFVEFDWQRSTGPGAANGTLALLVDDVPVSTLSGLDTDLMTVEDGRMGVMSVKTGAAGTIFFDQFESRRLRAIGPE